MFTVVIYLSIYPPFNSKFKDDAVCISVHKFHINLLLTSHYYHFCHYLKEEQYLSAASTGQ